MKKRDDSIPEPIPFRPRAARNTEEEKPKLEVRVMELDAAGFAEMLQGQSPQPTLESIREDLAAFDVQTASMLTGIREIRVALRDQAAQDTVISALHLGDKLYAKECMLKEAAADDPRRGLSLDETMKHYWARCWDGASFAAAIGLYFGWLLAGRDFRFDDIRKLASDPVFVYEMITGKLTRENAADIARARLAELFVLDGEAN